MHGDEVILGPPLAATPIWDFFALLLGVGASFLGIGAVLALYLSVRDAGTRIAGANERASSAVERAAALEKEAAEARLKLALLQKQVGPRVIDRDALLNELKGKRKPDKISIVWSRAAKDGWYVATQLQRLLVEAEWPVDAEGPVAIDTDSPFLRDKPGTRTTGSGR